MKLLSNRQSSSIIFLLTLLPALVPLVDPYAFATRWRRCPDLTPCEAYGGAEAVFVGRAISGEEIKWDDRNSGGKLIQLVGKVRFIVEQSFKFKIIGYEDIGYYVVASSAPKPVEPYSASSMYFYSEPQLVELKRENVTGLRLTLSWDKGTLRDFFEKKRDQQK